MNEADPNRLVRDAMWIAANETFKAIEEDASLLSRRDRVEVVLERIASAAPDRVSEAIRE